MVKLYLAVQTESSIIACPIYVCCLWFEGEVTNPLLLERKSFNGQPDKDRNNILDAIDEEESLGTIKQISQAINLSKPGLEFVEDEISSVSNYMISKAAYQIAKSTRESVEVVRANSLIAPSIYYKSSVDSDCLGTYLARCIADYRREWMIDTVLAKTYSQYNWQNNRGRLTDDHVSAILKYGISHHHIEPRLKAIAQMWCQCVGNLGIEFILSRNYQDNPPIWWNDLMDGQPFGERSPAITGDYPIEFVEWMTNNKPEVKREKRELKDGK